MHFPILAVQLLTTLVLATPSQPLPPRATNTVSDFQFPILTPAFTFLVPISGLYLGGQTSIGNEDVISATSGTISTEFSFTEYNFAGTLIFGNDFLHDFSNGQPHRSLDGHGLFKTSNGTYVSWTCAGVTSNTTIPTETETQARGFATFKFETGDANLVGLSNSVWVSSLHFVIGGVYPVLEFKISKVGYAGGVVP